MAWYSSWVAPNFGMSYHLSNFHEPLNSVRSPPFERHVPLFLVALPAFFSLKPLIYYIRSLTAFFAYFAIFGPLHVTRNKHSLQRHLSLDRREHRVVSDFNTVCGVRKHEGTLHLLLIIFRCLRFVWVKVEEDREQGVEVRGFARWLKVGCW